MSLEQGEKYLSVKLNIGQAQHLIFKAINDGKENIDFALFNNKTPNSGESPDYRGKLCAAWVNTAKAGEPKVQEEQI